MKSDVKPIPFLKSFNVMEPRDYIRPSEYDVLISDVKHNDLIGPISNQLQVQYLKQVEHSPSQIPSVVEGILYGTNARPMINLVMCSKIHRKWVNIIFLIDTGSPGLYVCDKAMKELGFNDIVSS